MKKIILLSSTLLMLVSCAQNKLNPPAEPVAESPNQNPTDPPVTQPPVDRSFEKLQSDVAFYKGRYQMPDIYKKITSERGNDFEDLYGTRNMREVLAGVYYRGGGNNKYHRKNPRSNTNPLPADGLDNLCKEGFSLGLYYYETNYKTAKPVNDCKLRTTGETQTLNYKQLTAFSVKDFKPFLQLVHDCRNFCRRLPK